MKLKTIALATAFALSSTFAFAQAGGSDSGAEVPNASGAVVNPNSGAVVGTTTSRNGTMMNGEPGTTTGMSRDEIVPQGMKPGSIDESKPGGQSTARKPPS
jgi:hypothetical protein